MEHSFKLYVLFNKSTRKPSTYTFDVSGFPDAILNTMLIKEYSFESLGLTDNNINLNRFRWEGDYDEGRLVDLVSEKKAVVTEEEIRSKYNGLFFSKFKIEDVLYQLLLNVNMTTEYGKEMQEFVVKLIKRRTSDMEYFSKSDLHIWEAEDDVKIRQKDAFKI
jgi:hypothetical protein